MCIKCSEPFIDPIFADNVPVWVLLRANQLERESLTEIDRDNIIKRTWYTGLWYKNSDRDTQEVFFCFVEYKYWDGYQDVTDEIEIKISRKLTAS